MNYSLPKSLIKTAFVSFFIALLIFLTSLAGKRPLNATFQPETFVSDLIHPLNGISGAKEPLYILNIENPITTVQTDDMEIEITLQTISRYFEFAEANAYGGFVDPNDPPSIDDGYFIEIELYADSFRILPSSTKIPLTEGYSTIFIASPTSQGSKKILVKSRLETPQLKSLPFETKVLTVDVDPTSSFGLSRDTITDLQVVSGIIGLPSLIILIINQIVAKKSKKRKG
jgi:hypothetical protein